MSDLPRGKAQLWAEFVKADDLVQSLSFDLEGAYQSGDRMERERVTEQWHAALTLKAQAWDRYAPTVPPTFEDLLRDPTQQLDPGGVVLRSILNYQDGQA